MISPIRTVFGLLIIVTSCASPLENKKENLEYFLAEKGINYSQFSSILVLTEEACPACTHSFASLLEKQIENKNSLLIISAKGALVDISMFLEAEEEKNILYDWKLDFKNQGIAEGSNAIFLKNTGAIDTIVPIKAKGLKNTLAYISDRLESQ